MVATTNPMMLERSLGVTGGIGCGKSTVGKMLVEKGWGLIDTDEIARSLLVRGEENWKKVVDAFGRSILNEDESINRRVLGDLVFSTEAARQQLNKLTHPSIRAAWISQRNDFLAEYPQKSIAVIIPLLFEVGLDSEFATIATVGCSECTQHKRLEARGWTKSHCQQRLASQLSLDEKIQRSHIVFWNEGPFARLSSQVELFVTASVASGSRLS